MKILFHGFNSPAATLLNKPVLLALCAFPFPKKDRHWRDTHCAGADVPWKGFLEAKGIRLDRDISPMGGGTLRNGGWSMVSRCSAATPAPVEAEKGAHRRTHQETSAQAGRAQGAAQDDEKEEEDDKWVSSIAPLHKTLLFFFARGQMYGST